MPTTASSNNPHVRITRETHQRIRKLAILTGFSQGDLVDELVTERLAAMGNPHLKFELPPRQRRTSEVAAIRAALKPAGKAGPRPKGTAPPKRRWGE